MNYVEFNPQRASLINPGATHIVRRSGDEAIINAGSLDAMNSFIRTDALMRRTCGFEHLMNS